MRVQFPNVAAHIQPNICAIDGHSHGRRPALIGVSVGPDRLFARRSDAERHVIPTGLDLTGSVRGRLHGRFPSVEGDWLGVANHEIGYTDGRRDKRDDVTAITLR